MVRRQQAADRAVRPKLRSPGHPKFVAPAVGARWFRHAGGMAPFDIGQQPSGRYLSFAEREEIAILMGRTTPLAGSRWLRIGLTVRT